MIVFQVLTVGGRRIEWDADWFDSYAQFEEETTSQLVAVDEARDEEDVDFIQSPIVDSSVDYVVFVSAEDAPEPDADVDFTDPFSDFMAVLADVSEQIVVVAEQEPEQEYEDVSLAQAFADFPAAAVVTDNEQITVIVPEIEAEPEFDTDLFFTKQVDEAPPVPPVPVLPLQENLTKDMLGLVTQTGFYTD